MNKISIIGTGEEIIEHTLSNGFKIYMWKYDLSDEISMSLVTKYGSKDTHFKVDNKDITVPNGIAHFLEHIKFNEKEGVNANDFYSKIGSYANAFTTYDCTAYEVTTNKDVKTNLEHLLYYVFNPYFTNEIIEKEKGIIIEEAKGSVNNAYAKGYHKLLENIYKNNTRRYLITGTPEEVESITMEDVLNAYNNFYVPSNMFLTIGGNIDINEVIDIVEEFFKDKEYNLFKAVKTYEKEPIKVEKVSDSINGNVNKNKAYLAYKYDRNLFNKDKMTVRMCFNRILSANFGTISEFNEYLIQNKIVDEISYDVIVEDDTIVVLFEISADDLVKVRTLIDDKMNNLSITNEEFERIKKTKIASVILGYDNPSTVINNLGIDIIEYDHIIDNIKVFQENSKIEDVLETIKLLDNSNKTYLDIYPNK